MIDVIVTGCGREDLTLETVKSFFQVNTYPVNKLIVHEDGPENFELFKEIEKMYPAAQFRWTDERVGQIESLDNAMRYVTSEFFITLENDWAALQDGFIPKAIELMEQDPMIHCAWLRGTNIRDVNCHPMIDRGGYMEMKRDWVWKGFTFGVSVKRKSHYDMIGGYGQHARFDFERPWTAEHVIDDLYAKKGFYAVSLKEKYFSHLGKHTTPKP